MDWIAGFAVAVMIAGQGISDEQVAHWAKASGGPTGALSFLVIGKWTEGEAQERGVKVSDQEAKEATTEEPHDGLTRQDLIYEAKLSLLTAGIRAQIEQPAAQSVTPEQIRAYVDANPKQLPERRRVRILPAKTRRTAAQAQKAITHGLTWRAAAKRYASGTGNPRIVERGDYDQEVEAAIFKAATNFTVRYRTYVFRVTAVLPERPMPRDQQEAIAWEILSNQAQQQAIDAFTGAFQEKWRQRTTCAPAYQANPVCGQPPAGQQTP